MHRSFVSILAAVAMSAVTAHAQDGPPPRTIPVADGLHLFLHQGGNVAISTGEDGPVIVDDQFSHSGPAIAAAVAALQEGPVRFVLNTHWHGDHTGSNAFFHDVGALVVAHTNVRERLSTRQVAEMIQRDQPAAAPEAWPVLTFDEGITLHWNGQDIEVEHVANAHTDGDSHVWFPGVNAVHMGDTFFHGMYPFIDIWSGGSMAGMIASADRVLARADDETKIMPGHGPLTDRAGLVAYRELLVTVRDRVANAQAEGGSLEDFVASEPLADLDPTYGGGFMKADRFVSIVWADLARE